MVTLKANMLHWHVTDDPAWSTESAVFPNFTDSRYGGPLNSQAFYSVEDQSDIIAYAWARGIMIIFELDVPGHASSWAAGNPDLVVSCEGGQTLINPVPTGAIPGAPPTGADLYAVLEVRRVNLQGLAWDWATSN